MATYATLTINAADIIGADFDRSRCSAYIETNTPHGLVIVDGTNIRLGGRRENPDDTGTITFPNLVTTNSADNPTSFAYKVTIVYVPKGSRKQGHDSITTAEFPLTADADLASISAAWDDIAIPPNWKSDFRAEMEAVATTAAASATSAAASASAAGTITGLGTVDEALVFADADPESTFRQQQDSRLSATIGAATGPKADRAVSPRDTQRVKVERKPTAHIAQAFPNAWHDHQIVWTNNARRVWAIGRDRRLRSSGNGGVQWEHLAHSGTNRWAKLGLFLITQAGSMITTQHADGAGTWPSIVRSTNSGLSFTEVIPATTGIEYQGVTSICQDPSTGYIYLIEYVGTEALSFRILRSTDDGATWTTFHTFPSNGEANFVRHGHAVQYDPVGGRVWFLVGDAEQNAGMYRTTADGTGVEPAFLNKHSLAGDGLVATAVGMMFFPDYVAWGMDQTTDSWLIRVPRSQLGLASPTYEKVARLQSTAFHCIRAKADASEWVMAVSNENIGVGSLDRTVHLYRVADNAATVDEVLSWAPAYVPDTTGRYPYPVGTPLQNDADGLIWLAMLTQGPLDPISTTMGQQYAIRLGWGTTPAVTADTISRKPFYAPATQSGGAVSLAANETKVFGGIKVPSGETRRFYLIDMGTITTLGGSTVEVWNATKGAYVKDAATATNMTTTSQSVRESLKRETGPYVYSTALLDAGDVLHFRIKERTGAAGTFSAFVNYAFGI